MKSVLNTHWKDWCWSWNSSTLAIWCEELTHWQRPWCWERLMVEGEGDDRGWDGWMHHRLNEHEFEWTPGVGDRQEGLVCCSPWGRKVRHDWATELNRNESSETEYVYTSIVTIGPWKVVTMQMCGTQLPECESLGMGLRDSFNKVSTGPDK